MANCFPDQPRSAVILIAPAEPNGTKQAIPCMFQGLHGKRLTLETSEGLSVGKVISVEYDDSLFLGEVISSLSSENACSEKVWSIEVKVEQILNGLQSLMALRSRLLSEGVPQPFGTLHSGVLN